MASALDEAASLLRTRIQELDAERKKLERALANLTGGRAGRRGPGRPPGSGGDSRRRGRRGGTRSDQAVRFRLTCRERVSPSGHGVLSQKCNRLPPSPHLPESEGARGGFAVLGVGVETEPQPGLT